MVQAAPNCPATDGRLARMAVVIVDQDVCKCCWCSFGAVMAAREREDRRIVTLQLAELAQLPRVIGQFLVGENAPGAMSERTRNSSNEHSQVSQLDVRMRMSTS